MKSKKVMIYAYSNFNLGDDLFIRILSERYPETQFILYAPKDYRNQYNYDTNVKVYSNDNIFIRIFNYILRRLKIKVSIRDMLAKNSDAIVRIGGSIFMQRDEDSTPKISNKLVMNKPYFILGANFGPYKDEEYYEQHYELFKHCTDICFRDHYSYQLFKDLENVRRADDIVFNLKSKGSINEKSNIVISVIQPSYRKELQGYDEIYYEKIKDIIYFFIKKEYKVTLMSFCENEGDEKAIEEILYLVSPEYKKNIEEYKYKSNMDNALKVISSASYVIATRFHAMILGWLYNKPVFPIAYSKKMNNVMNEIKYIGTYIDIQNINKLNLEEVYLGIDKNTVDINSQKRDAELHFKELDKLLS